MLIPNHPADERLAAWADADPDARADRALVEHVPTCSRCTDLVDELGLLRAALADLPDVRPPRPLRLVPPVADAPAVTSGGVAGWVRRLFAPMMTAGAALALVGVVGTSLSAFQGAGAGGADSGSTALEADEAEASERLSSETMRAASEPSSAEAPAAGGEAAPSSGMFGAQNGGDPSPTDVTTYDTSSDRTAEQAAPIERPIWPMLLFTGVAIIIGTLLLRWILLPRAG